LKVELSGSMFDAALDAATGSHWSRFSRRYARKGERSVDMEVDDGGVFEDRYRSTQERQMVACMDLVGVGANQDEKTREQLADLLGVEQMLLLEQSKKLEAGCGPGVRGQAVCAVLRAMPGAMRYERFLACGREVGLWGEALYWEPGLSAPRRAPFRLSGTRAPPGV